jgi:DNA repair protein RadD
MFEKRQYQIDTVKALMRDIPDYNPVVAIPTGGGKTVIMSMFIDEYLKIKPLDRILVISDRKRILVQNHETISKFFPNKTIGLYAKGLKSTTIESITVAGIQSIYRKKDKIKFKRFDLIIIDECHAIPPKKKSMYMQFLDIVNTKRVGLSATPFRMGSGLVYGDNGEMFNKLSYDLTSLDNFNDLVEQEYLSKIYSKGTFLALDPTGIKITSGDYNKKQLSEKFDRNEITKNAIEEIIKFGQYYKSWLIFAIDIEHAENINKMLLDKGIKSKTLHSKSEEEDDIIIEQFKNFEIQAVVSVEKITTGFDAPNIDMIAILRPTKSLVLHVQMAGRGLRTYSGKDHCLLLDFAGNTERLGPINDIRIPSKKSKKKNGKPIVRKCPKCWTLNHLSHKQCAACGFVFPVIEKIKKEATYKEIIRQLKKEWVEVHNVHYNIHKKRNSTDSLKVSYETKYNTIDEYVCLDHLGYAEELARKWVSRRWNGSIQPPETVHDLFWERSSLRVPRAILVEFGGKFPQIKNYIF